MINQIEFDAIESCSNDKEIFYFIYAEVNYGGQVLSEALERDIRGPHFEEKVSAREICQHLHRLLEGGLLECFTSAGKDEEKLNTDQVEFETYDGYGCVTFGDHIERYTYGPHLFHPTESGLKAAEEYAEQNAKAQQSGAGNA